MIQYSYLVCRFWKSCMPVLKEYLWPWPLNFDIRATSWENLFMLYTNNKGADQPAHLRSLISTFVGYCLDSIIPILAKSKISSLAEQASISLTWSPTAKTSFLVTWLICCGRYDAALHRALFSVLQVPSFNRFYSIKCLHWIILSL